MATIHVKKTQDLSGPKALCEPAQGWAASEANVILGTDKDVNFRPTEGKPQVSNLVWKGSSPGCHVSPGMQTKTITQEVRGQRAVPLEELSKKNSIRGLNR